MKALRLALAVVLLLSPALLVAQRANLRLGTILPANSVWDRALKQMASEWQQTTDGRVRLQVRGTTGDEATIIRRMRLNNPQVAALTLPGLTEIDDAFNALGIPFFLASDAEALHVLEALTPLYREALAEHGLVLLNWGHGGWVHIFSAQPIRNIPDLQKAKLFTAAGDDGMVQWYKQNGFQPVPLELTDVLMGLNTGLIDAYPSPPYGALVFQWYRQTSHMLDVPLSPVFGATVMTERAWNRIDEADRDAAARGRGGDAGVPVRRGAPPGPGSGGRDGETGPDGVLGQRGRGRHSARRRGHADCHVARRPCAGGHLRRGARRPQRVPGELTAPPPHLSP